MTRPFNDDVNRGPDLPRDWRKSKEFEEFKNRTLPTLPSPPPALYPWWVNPPTPPALPDPAPGSYPYWVNPPTPPMLPSPDPGTRYPFNFAPAGISPATGAAPAAGGLLGMLYEMMRQSEPKPDGGFDSNPQDVSQQAPPERQLVRRTYRQ
jgi:hypothetical protein